MAEARSEADWGRTSSLLALIANANRPKGRRAYKPADFDPTRPRKQDRTFTGLAEAKTYFVPDPPPPEVEPQDPHTKGLER